MCGSPQNYFTLSPFEGTVLDPANQTIVIEDILSIQKAKEQER